MNRPAEYPPGRPLLKSPTVALSEQLENGPPLVQPLGCGVVWLRGKEPDFRLERRGFESICGARVFSFRHLIFPSRPHLSGSRSPTSDGAGEESTRVVGRCARSWPGYSAPPALDTLPGGAVGVVKATWLEPEASGGLHPPLLGTGRVGFWSLSNLPSQHILAPGPPKSVT